MLACAGSSWHAFNHSVAHADRESPRYARVRHDDSPSLVVALPGPRDATWREEGGRVYEGEVRCDPLP